MLAVTVVVTVAATVAITVVAATVAAIIIFERLIFTQLLSPVIY